MSDNLNPIECAKILRKVLKEKFSETFNVTTKTIDSYARVIIEWENGASYDEIKALTNPYLYKDNDDSDNGIYTKSKYIVIKRMFTSSIIESLSNVLIGDEVINDTERENVKQRAKSILLKHTIPYGSTKILSYNEAEDSITFNSNESSNIPLPIPVEEVKVRPEYKSTASETEKVLLGESDDIKVFKYSEKSFVLIGENTKKYKDKIMQINGRYNSNLNMNGERVKGWVFSLKKINEVKAMLNI